MHEIKIYGEIVPFEEQWIIDQGGFYNLSSFQASLKEAKEKILKFVFVLLGAMLKLGLQFIMSYVGMPRITKQRLRR